MIVLLLSLYFHHFCLYAYENISLLVILNISFRLSELMRSAEKDENAREDIFATYNDQGRK